MDSKDIVLTNGEVFEVKVNFLTLFLIIDLGIDEMQKKLEKKPDDKKLSMRIAAKIIYIIIRSNGKKVTEEEAMILCPADDQVLQTLITTFSEKVQKLKKNEDMKM